MPDSIITTAASSTGQTITTPTMGTITINGKTFAPADDITAKEAALLAAMFAAVSASKWGCDPWPFVKSHELDRHFK